MSTPGISRTPTFAEVLESIIKGFLTETSVAIPARVETYDATQQLASVKPLIKRLIQTEDEEELLESIPVIPNVPVMFPRAGGFFITMPVQAGDIVLCIFADRSLDSWLSSDGAETTPDDFRNHDLTDAIAIPGVFPFSQAINADVDDMVMGKNGGAVLHIADDQINLFEKSAADFVALAADTKSQIEAVRNSLNSFVTIFNAHVHAGVTTGPGSSAISPTPAVPPGPVGNVAATKVKAT